MSRLSEAFWRRALPVKIEFRGGPLDGLVRAWIEVPPKVYVWWGVVEVLGSLMPVEHRYELKGIVRLTYQHQPARLSSGLST